MVMIEVVASATLIGVVAAQETTSLFLPYFAPGHPLLASVVDTVSVVSIIPFSPNLTNIQEGPHRNHILCRLLHL